MNPNENWIAEQARLVMLEDGFGPSYAANGSRGSVGADVAGETVAATT
jgi:hypothetical protein